MDRVALNRWRMNCLGRDVDAVLGTVTAIRFTCIGVID